MCFSAGASFTAAFVLSLVGIMTMREVRQRAWYGIALVPALFALQQAIEGMVWISQGMQPWWVYLYLLFVLLVWPVWMPLSLWLIERNKKHAHILKGCLFIGVFAAAAFMYELVFYGATAAIIEHHVRYYFILPFYHSVFVSYLLYAVPVIGSFFASSNRMLHMYGIMVFFAAGLSMLVWEFWFTSIWCFFGALISIGALLIVRREQHS